MSDCNCKSKNIGSLESNIKNKGKNTNSVIMYGIKGIGFLFSLILLPIINIVLIKMLFKAIVLNKTINLKEVLEYYFKNKKKEDDEEDEDESLEENEYEMLNVEEITKNE